MVSRPLAAALQTCPSRTSWQHAVSYAPPQPRQSRPERLTFRTTCGKRRTAALRQPHFEAAPEGAGRRTCTGEQQRVPAADRRLSAYQAAEAYRLTASAQAASERSMSTACEQPLFASCVCPLGSGILSASLRVQASPLRAVFTSPPSSAPPAPLGGAEDFFWLGGHPGHGCFAGRDNPPRTSVSRGRTKII